MQSGKKQRHMTEEFDNSDFDFDGSVNSAEIEIGVALGRYEAYQEVAYAVKKGELDKWLEDQTPKSWEDWEKYDLENGVRSERLVRDILEGEGSNLPTDPAKILRIGIAAQRRGYYVPEEDLTNDHTAEA